MSRRPGLQGTADERRDSYRLPARDAALEVVGEGAPRLALVDLSASGGAVVLRDRSVEELGRPLRLRLGDLAPFPVSVAPVRERETGGDRVLGVRLLGLETSGQAALSRFLLSRFLDESVRGGGARRGFASVVVGRRGAAACLRLYGLAQGRPLRLREPSGLPLPLGVEEVSDDAFRARLLALPAAPLEEGSLCDLELPGGQVLHSFSARLLGLSGSRVSFALPRTVLRVGFRSSPRAALAPGARVLAHLGHPRLRLARLDKLVLEVSARGLVVPLEPERDLLAPGDRISELVLELPDGPVEARAVLRSVSGGAEGAPLRAGLELVGLADPEHAERWSRFVFLAGHPRLELGRASTLGDAWRVLRSSGYLEEAEGEEPELRRRFFSAWGRVADDRSVSRFFLLRERGEAVGTLALSLVSPGTWLVHHLGIDATTRRRDREAFFDIAREVYSGNTFLLQHLAAADHYLAYMAADKPWNDLIYSRFLRDYPRPDDFVWDKYSVFRLPVDDPERLAGPQLGGRLSVVQPAGSDRAGLARRLAARLPRVEVEGLAYCEDLLDLRAFAQACGARGLGRRRHLRLALDRTGEPLALLVAEVGPDGLNVFGLLNRCWILPLTSDAVAEAERLLLAEAARVYAAEGKTSPIYLARPDENRKELSSCGLRHVANGLRWLARKTVLPAHQQYIDELLAMNAQEAAARSRDARPAAPARGAE